MKKYILSAFLASCLFPALAQPPKPNIIIILADDLGWGDVGYHGSEIKTPHLDQLAKTGIEMDRFYTAAVCSPTRAGLMTGRYPDRFGLRETVIPPWSEFYVDTTEVLLPEYLANAGYQHRAMIGKWHLGHAKQQFLPRQRGFTHFYGHYNGAIDYFTHEREGELDWHRNEEPSYDKGYSTDLLADEAVNCIKNYSKEKAPFFIYLAFNAPHGPLQAKREDLDEYGFDPDKPLFGKSGPNAPQGKGNTERQTYSAMVSNMDRNIGKVLKALKDAGADENTLVIFHSDNGGIPEHGGSTGGLRGSKFTEWEGGTRAPAIVKWPAAWKGGRKITAVSGFIDVLPTICEITGAKHPSAKVPDGKSMVAILAGGKTDSEREIYLGLGALIYKNWKIVRAGMNESHVKITEDQLFDIMADPGEKNNIREKQPEVYKELLARVKRYDAITSSLSVPPYGEGRKGFKAPKEWLIKD